MKQSNELKFMLVQFLADLDINSLPKQKQHEVKDIISMLSKRTTVIPDSPKWRESTEWKLQLYRFIELFFCAYPKLMTLENRMLLENYLNEQFQHSKKLRIK